MNQRIESYLNNTTNLRPLYSTHYAILCPQNGDRIVAIDSVMSLHRMYTKYCVAVTAGVVVLRSGSCSRRLETISERSWPWSWS